MSKGAISLEGVFYDEDGNFIPLTASEGNTYDAVSHLRNTYMEAEREYFELLLSDRTLRKYFGSYLEFSAEELFEAAMKLQTQIETGTLETPKELERMKSMSPEIRDLFHMQKLEKAEGVLCLLLAAIKDKVLIKELIHIMDKEDEVSRGR